MYIGLKSVPVTFQGFINNLFANMLWKSVFASKDPEKHLKTLQRQREACLNVNLSGNFFKVTIIFLGYEVDGKEIHTSDDKITAIKKFTKPQCVDNILSFLSLAGYCRPYIIHNFASKATPQTRFLRKENTFHWGATQETSFQELKYAITQTPVLPFRDYKDPPLPSD